MAYYRGFKAEAERLAVSIRKNSGSESTWLWTHSTWRVIS
jgi:hypothetical protein